jgi:thioredoxin-related protein
MFMIIPAMVFAGQDSWIGFNEGMKKAAASGKLVIVDFSTEWCVWCKKMDTDVFSKSDIAARLSKDFVTVRLDAESAAPLTYKGRSMKTSSFTTLMKVDGYPTLIVFDAKGNVVSRLSGYTESDLFNVFLDYLGKGCYRKVTFEQFYFGGRKCD